MNRDLDYVLNYMVKYTKDRFMQDSEPMLNHKDIEIVLKHIYELQQENKQLKDKINTAIEYIKNEDIDICTIRNNDIVDTKNEFLEILGDKENE